MTTHATLWKNVTNPFEVSGVPEAEGYVNVWEGDLEGTADESNFLLFCEQVFSLHNRDDRPTGQVCPSASLGDVVQVDDHFFVCDRYGWTEIPCPDGGRADRPRTGVGCSYFARTADEYQAAEEIAKVTAHKLGIPVRF